MSLAGKTFLITGATGGMGRAVTQALLEKKAHVILVSKDEKKLLDLKRELNTRFPQSAITVRACDVSQTQEVNQSIHEILKEHPSLDGLVTLAGYNKNYAEISEWLPSPHHIQTLENIIQTDLLGTARFVFHLEPLFRARKKGIIISMAAITVLETWAQDLLFQMAKAGVKKMVESIAAQHARDGVTGVSIFGLAPGNVFNPTTYGGMTASRRLQADAEGWLDSKMHIAPILEGLLSEKLKIKSGTTLRLNLENVAKLFCEMNMDYVPFTPPENR